MQRPKHRPPLPPQAECPTPMMEEPRRKTRGRFPRLHIIRDIFALIGFGFVIVQLLRYVIIPLLIMLGGSN